MTPNNHVINSLDRLYKIKVVGKHGYFTSKPSSHTSQDNDTNDPDKYCCKNIMTHADVSGCGVLPCNFKNKT